MSEGNQDREILDGPFEDFKQEFLFDKPSLIKRIKCTIIDTMMIILIMYLISIVINGLNIKSGLVRGLALGLTLLYEPIMTSIARTIGQQIMGLRVLNFAPESINENDKKISLVKSLARYFFKVTLGWISLLTIHSDIYGRAIHDKVSSSIMTNE